MLVTDKFVFLHLPGTGGSLVYDIIPKFFPSAREIEYQLRREPLPKEFSSLPVLGTVANPWDFYASWYHHNRSHLKYSQSEDVLFAWLSQSGTLSFAETIQNALELGVDDNKLEFLVRSLPEQMKGQESGTPLMSKVFLQTMRGTGIGLYSFLFKQLFDNLYNVSFCRAESLTTDLIGFFERLGLLSPTLRACITDVAKNASAADGHYSTFYNPDLAALVSLRDRQLIERFGFVFEKASSGHALRTAQTRPQPSGNAALGSVIMTRNASDYRSKSVLLTLPKGAKTVVTFNNGQLAAQLQRPQLQNSPFLTQIAAQARVIIIEGISGSGKDTLQMYLKQLLKDRDIHDYSEGELLQSWNQLQIGGIFELRLKFMKLFTNYMNHVLSRDENALFLLNRFHLSTYVSTVVRQPTLERQYVEIVDILRKMPVHVLILRLDDAEMDERGAHLERSTAWHKYQKQIIEREGFQNTLARHMWQQEVILQTAERQQIPYSVIKLSTAVVAEDITASIAKSQISFRREPKKLQACE
jgi:thymidylate kinase